MSISWHLSVLIVFSDLYCLNCRQVINLKHKNHILEQIDHIAATLQNYSKYKF